MATVVSLGIDVPAEPVLVCGGSRFGAPALEEPPRPASLPAELVLAAAAALSDFRCVSTFALDRVATSFGVCGSHPVSSSAVLDLMHWRVQERSIGRRR